MQRLTDDFIARDLDYIFEKYADFTRPTKIKVGSEECEVLASMQLQEATLNAESSPVNSYQDTLLVRYASLPKSMWKKLVRDAIIYIDNNHEGYEAFTITDTGKSGGLVSITLKRGASKGSLASNRPI